MADIAEHYRRFFPLIQAKCRRVLGNQQEAEDVAQETFIRLWQEQLTFPFGPLTLQ